MTFVSPLLLIAGSSLVVVPIVLHLMMRRKPKHVEFPALRFVAKRKETSQRRLRLRHLLLLLLRAAIIVLLAAALSRPSLKRASAAFGGRKAPVAAVLIFDASKRMDYRFENRTRLETATELGGWILEQLPPESRVAVVDGRSPDAVFQVDLGAAKHRIERLETAFAVQSVPESLAAAMRLLRTAEQTRKEIYIFTDLAKAAWPAEASQTFRELYREMPEVGIQVIDVGVEKPSNLALGDLRLSAQTLSSRSVLRLESELLPVGVQGKRNVELNILEPAAGADAADQRRPRKVGERVVEFETGRPQRLDFTVSNLPVGVHQGYLEILGQDGMMCDDRRYFTVEVRPSWQVLIAAPKPAADYAVYLANALAPEVSRRRGDAKFEYRVVSLEELATIGLEPYAVTAVLDPRPLSEASWRRLVAYASGGRGVAVFLGRNADPIESFNRGPAQELLSGPLLRQALAPDDGVHFSPRNLDHPILAGFRGTAGGGVWSRLPVYRYWQLGAPPRGVHVVAALTNGEPVLLERPVGRGKCLTMTTPISDPFSGRPWNLLPAEWPFLALMDGAMTYLAGGADRSLNYVPGQTALLDLDPAKPFRAYVLNGPEGPPVTLTPNLQKNILAVDTTGQAGNYRVRAGGAEGVERGFSVNLPAEQTRLDRLATEDLTRFFGDATYRLARDRERIDINISSDRVGRELFGALILALALTVAAEQFVANRFYRT